MLKYGLYVSCHNKSIILSAANTTYQFIRHLDIPYCSLYDLGYTSLGGTTDTHPNPALRAEGDESAESKYRPAYELMADEAERLGRDKK